MLLAEGEIRSAICCVGAGGAGEVGAIADQGVQRVTGKENLLFRLAEASLEGASRGLDTWSGGEGPHHTAIEATELGIVVLYAGHYATETLGVRALGDEVAAHFGLTSVFIDKPSGL